MAGGLVVVELGQLGLDPGRSTAAAPAPAAWAAIVAGTASSPSSTLARNSTGLPVSGDRSRSAFGAASGTGTVRAASPVRGGDQPAEPRLLGDLGLVPAGPPRHPRLTALGLLEVGVEQLRLDRLDVGDGVDPALRMDDLLVAMCAHHV